MSSTAGDKSPSVVKLVNATFTGTTPVAIWAPTTGRRIYFQGCSLRARVTTALVGATPGNTIVIAENVFNPIGELGMIATATDAPSTNYGNFQLDLSTGYTFTAADASLYASTLGSTTIGTGVIRVCGLVWGDEL